MQRPIFWIHSQGRGRFWSPVPARALNLLLDGIGPGPMGRLKAGVWWLYRVDLDRVSPPPREVTLRPVTQTLMERLRAHPDRQANQLISGFRFWEHGLDRAFVWMWRGEPLCIQWLLLPEDNARLLALPEWGGMYHPLEPGEGRVENLFKFSTGRRPPQGAAVSFQHAVFAEARRQGVRRLYTHIHRGNDPANAFARRAGWQRAGWIRRYEADLPGLRRKPLVMHRIDPLPQPAAVPACHPV